MRIIFTVTTDLVFDQRMQRICRTLAAKGCEVKLIGRVQKKSPPIKNEPFKQVRLNCLFRKGFAFYAEYNLRLFFYCLGSKSDVFCAIDLDTILAVTVAAKVRGKKLVFDAHEHFTEMEEVVHRPVVRSVWKSIERCCVPFVSGGYTVSRTIADTFEKEYSIMIQVIRNMAVYDPAFIPRDNFEGKQILYQGAVNYGRGLFDLVKAMQNIDARLVICGQGPAFESLQLLANNLELAEKIAFKGFVRPDDLLEITRSSSLGITLFEANGKSNYYSLANRYFDYVQAGIPQLAMNYPEYAGLNSQYEVATLIDRVEPDLICEALNKMLNQRSYYETMRLSACKARAMWNWQQEEEKLWQFYAALSVK